MYVINNLVFFKPEQQVFTSAVTETFLLNENPDEISSDRIQKIDDKGIYSYSRIITRKVGTIIKGVPNEIKKILNPLEYIYLLTNKKDPSRESVEIIKSCFVYQKQY